jgi:hypothetical protein
MVTCTEGDGSGSVLLFRMGMQPTTETPTLQQAQTVSSTQNME